jgi:hypothetical protein
LVPALPGDQQIRDLILVAHVSMRFVPLRASPYYTQRGT